jgi:uncharacterized protein YndB with AHSA1/START domain
MVQRTRTITQILIIPATPDEVYQAMMDPEIHADFTGDKASGSDQVGGMFYAADGYITARNLELIKGQRIVQQWTTSEWPDKAKPSLLTITLTEIPEGTELTMVHSDVPLEEADDYEEGWKEYYWEPMVRYFEKRNKPYGKKKQNKK